MLTASVDAWVMVNPAAAYRFLAAQPLHRDIWLGLKRPLFVAFVLGCTVSLLASATLTPRLVGSASLYCCFVPFSETAALIAVCWRERYAVSFPRTIDAFFAGHGPWLLWLIGCCAIWGFLSPAQIFIPFQVWFDGVAVIVVVWSAFIDFWFFRIVLGRSSAGAARALLAQRALSWALILLIFGQPAIAPEVASWFGR